MPEVQIFPFHILDVTGSTKLRKNSELALYDSFFGIDSESWKVFVKYKISVITSASTVYRGFPFYDILRENIFVL